MIKIITVGKLKEKYLIEAKEEYQKRISKYTKLEIIEINDEKEEIALKKEEENILKHIKNEFVITLEIEGKELDSLEFAKCTDNLLAKYSNITFVIGGSYGLGNKIKERSNLALSFSKMTFPHQLFRIILLEQLYRAFKINNNETYHK